MIVCTMCGYVRTYVRICNTVDPLPDNDPLPVTSEGHIC